MDKKINLSQLADLLSQAGGMSKTASEQFVKNFFEIISQYVLSDGLVKVKGLGTFKILQMEDRESVNVNTGERFTIEGHQKISFTPDPDLKERINKPFSAFETIEITAEQADEIAKAQSNEEQKPVEQTVKAEPQANVEKEKATSPEVNDITQKKSVRILLKFIIWLFSILLALVLAIYLLWPILGNRILGVIEREVTDQRKTEMVADSTEKTVVPVKESVPVQPSEPVAKPAEPQVKPAEPAVKPVEPAAKPVEPAVKPATTPAQQPATTPAQPSVNPVRFQLNKADEAKDLTEFTEADTVNYIMDGEMTVHVLQSGETITVLALKYYGSKKLWPYIVKYNNISNANGLRPGTKIRIPVLKSK